MSTEDSSYEAAVEKLAEIQSVARQIVHWPGKDTAACERHLEKLVGLGAILGIQVSWTPCNPTVCANCESEKPR